MRFKIVPVGHVIEVGNHVIQISAFGAKSFPVVRVTPKYAFVKHNEVSEGKFPRIYGGIGFKSLPAMKWCTSEYKVGIPVTDEPVKNEEVKS